MHGWRRWIATSRREAAARRRRLAAAAAAVEAAAEAGGIALLAASMPRPRSPGENAESRAASGLHQTAAAQEAAQGAGTALRMSPVDNPSQLKHVHWLKNKQRRPAGEDDIHLRKRTGGGCRGACSNLMRATGVPQVNSARSARCPPGCKPGGAARLSRPDRSCERGPLAGGTSEECKHVCMPRSAVRQSWKQRTAVAAATAAAFPAGLRSPSGIAPSHADADIAQRSSHIYKSRQPAGSSSSSSRSCTSPASCSAAAPAATVASAGRRPSARRFELQLSRLRPQACRHADENPTW